MGEFDVGQPVARTEDPRLLTGGGRYTDDISLPGQARGLVVRSPHAHARILSVDTARASAMPGVLSVLTGADYLADNLGDLRCLTVWNDGQYQNPCPALAVERVRYVGDPIVFIVAETLNQARDAAEALDISYEPLPSTVSTAHAADNDAPLVWDDCPGNRCFTVERGDADGCKAGFGAAEHVVERTFHITRMVANTIEPRAYVGLYDATDHRYTLHTALHYPHKLREQLARDVFRVGDHDVRIVAGDIGGSFGLRGGTYPEQVLVLWAARRVGRPVKWTEERSEGHLAGYQGRDNVSTARLALDKDGNFLALHVSTLAALGAYITTAGSGPPVNNLGTLAGTYRTPAIHVEVTAVYTNTTPTSPYRGAGRPEAAYIIETLIDDAARLLRMDPAELRRRNTIPPDAMPFKTGLVFTYDCGEFERNLDDALTMIDYDGFEARREEAEARGRLRGIGISNTIERAGAPSMEEATVRIGSDGKVTVLVGTISQGQGHDTVYKQIVSQHLGVPIGDIRVREGDTDLQGVGGGTGGSRSATCGGGAVYRAVEAAVAKGRVLAAHRLEASVEDIEFADGAFSIGGTDRSITLQEIARKSYMASELPEGVSAGIDERVTFSPKTPNFPNGCHACEVEIDPETGESEIVNYVIVDDVGTVLNPMLLKGQIHGGVAQGVGQAVMEQAVYDANGQPLAASFIDYAMPRADDFCMFEVKSNPVPTRQNPLGVKGAGEAGTVGALPAVMNAIENALGGLAEAGLEMPATPERTWRASRGMA